MAKIEFQKKIFILEEITGPSQNLIFSQRVLSQSFSWNIGLLKRDFHLLK